MNMWTWGPALHELQNGHVTLKTQAKRPPWGQGRGVECRRGGVRKGLLRGESENLLTTEPPPLQPAAQIMQDMERIQAEQKRMESQGESWGRGRLGSRAKGGCGALGIIPDTSPAPITTPIRVCAHLEP